MNQVSLQANIWSVALFLMNHWTEIGTFIGLVVVWFNNKNINDAKAAKDAALKMTVDAVTSLAAQELDTKEKRDRAISMVMEVMPANVSKFITKDKVGELVEVAWSAYVKPTLPKVDPKV